MKTIINFILHQLLVFLLGRSLAHKQCRDENRVTDDQVLQKSSAISLLPPPSSSTSSSHGRIYEQQVSSSSSSLPPSPAIYLSHLPPFISSSIFDSSAPHSSILLQFLPSVSFYLSQCGFCPLLSSLMSTGLIRLTR